MSQPAPDRHVAFRDCLLIRGKVTVDADQLSVRFDTHGPGASVRFPKDHVVLFREGDAEKLTSLGGYGGEGDEGSFFFVWRFRWQGGGPLWIRYVDGEQVLAEERLPVVV